MTLDEIQALLRAEGMITSIEETGQEPGEDGTTGKYLMVALSNLDDTRLYEFEIMRLPDPGDQVEHAHIWQIFVPLAEDLEPAHVAEMRAFLARVNTLSILPGFNLDESRDLIYYRYVLLAPRAHADGFGPVLVEAVWLSHYLVDAFSPYIAAVSSGLATADDAWSQLQS